MLVSPHPATAGLLVSVALPPTYIGPATAGFPVFCGPDFPPRNGGVRPFGFSGYPILPKKLGFLCGKYLKHSGTAIRTSAFSGGSTILQGSFFHLIVTDRF